jgi:hypothetical protein
MAFVKLVTPVFRASFPQLFVPKAMQEGQTPKYSVSAVFEPSKFNEADKKRWAAILELLDATSLEKFKKKVNDLPGNFKRAIRDGAEKADLEGYGEGKVFANLSSKLKPGVVDAEGNDMEADDIYPGCYMRATVSAYAYDQGGGKGIALGLQNIRFVRDGERLDARTDAGEDFKDVEDDRDETDPLG